VRRPRPRCGQLLIKRARAHSVSQVLEEVLLESQDILMQNESHQSGRQERLEAV
jgi:hypothetical protein